MKPMFDYPALPMVENPHVCIVSHLFPNRKQPLSGVFVSEGVRAMSRYRPVSVVAPVSYFPILRSCRGVPREDKDRSVTIRHPRYLALPKWLVAHRWRSFYGALKRGLKNADPQPSLFHTHWVYPDGYATARYARAQGKKMIVTVHGHIALTFPCGRRELVTDSLLAAERVITVSTELRTELITLGVREEKIRLIRNGYDPEKFSPKPRDEARTQLGLPESAPIAITVARLSSEKGIDTLLQAMDSCVRNDLLLYLIGDGPLRLTLETMVKQLGLSERVTFLGGIAHRELNSWFSAADVVCLPSFTEGCPVVLHEAFACGIPVVASAVGAITELVTTDDLGMLCPPGDHLRLAKTLDAAVSRAWDHARIAEYGRSFTWAAVAKETSAVYAEILD